MTVFPNSAPDSSTPSHFHPGLPVDEADVVEAFVLLVAIVVPVALVVVVVAAVPGMHWEYHALEYVQM
jgi:hypothetical protein